MTIEERAAALLRSWIDERGTTPAKVAEQIGLEPSIVERMVSGRETLELARLERVLAVLGVAPAEFFARLYAADAVPAAAPAPASFSASRAPAAASTSPAEAHADRPEQPITRREVEEVVASLRSMIDGMARMLDAERAVARTGDPKTGPVPDRSDGP